MSRVLRRDLEFVLPKLTDEERKSPQDVLNAIEGLIPERRGAYTLSEAESALAVLGREKSN